MNEGAVRWHVERLTDPEEAGAVAALEAAAFRRAPAPDLIARDLTHSRFARVYVLRTPDAQIAGFCTCWVLFDELHVQNMAIAPAIRRQGAAMALMRHVLAEAEAGGATRATLEVRAANQPARQLYEKLGFRVTAIRRAYYENPPDDGLIMWRAPGGAGAPGDRLSPAADSS
jgi:[ribosomal protein S18]-alanine N-acetyltransferase